jgi:hypothetical protein
VKIVRAGDNFSCQLGKGEQILLWNLLKLYPCISSAAQPGSGRKRNHSKELLEEALAEQRRENKKRLEMFLREKTRLEAAEKNFRFSLSTAELEWLLQILNDVRVGNWILLGAPEEKLELKLLDEKNAPYFWAMEMAGHFEMQILSALNA